MRVVSWMVVVSAIAALSWLGLSPVLSGISLPEMDAERAVGSVVTNTARTSTEVAQSELTDQVCEDAQADEAKADRPANPDTRKTGSTDTDPICKTP